MQRARSLPQEFAFAHDSARERRVGTVPLDWCEWLLAAICVLLGLASTLIATMRMRTMTIEVPFMMHVAQTPSTTDAVPTGHSMDEIESERSLDDIAPEYTADERAGCDSLRALVLAKLGWDKPPDARVACVFMRESLLRYYRARDSLAASAKMMIQSIKWRQEFDLERALREWQEDTSPQAERLRKAWPCCVHGVDRHGCPTYYARYGIIDMGALVRDAGFKRVLTLVLSEQRQLEEGLLKVARATGTHPVQVTCVADFEGMQWGRAMGSVKPFMALQNILDSHFPERLRVGVVVRAPKLFSGVYKLVEPFLTQDTRAKARIFGPAVAPAAALMEFVPPDQIPQFLCATS